MRIHYQAFQKWTDSPAFARLRLGCALLAVFAWLFYLQFGWLPLLVGLLPWGLRLAARRWPVRRTPLDLPVALFLAATLVAVWAAYHPFPGRLVFWLYPAAILLYYALAESELGELWMAAGLWSVCAFFVAGYSLLTLDWQDTPAKVDFLQQIALRWMDVRPKLGSASIYPNFAAGVVGPLLPFALALAWQARQKRRYGLTAFLGAGILLSGVLVLLSGCRGVWVALAGCLGLLLAWLVCLRAARGQRKLGRLYYSGLLALLAAGLVTGFVARPQFFVGTIDDLPGQPMTENRMDQALALIYLVQDFPFTGGGLRAFPGLYSYYIHNNPNYIWPHGHNVYLDVAMELGLPGFLALGWITLASLWLLLARPGRNGARLLRLAALASLFIMAIHGLVSDNIFHTNMAFFLLVVPGFAVALDRKRKVRQPGTARQPEAKSPAVLEGRVHAAHPAGAPSAGPAVATTGGQTAGAPSEPAAGRLAGRVVVRGGSLSALQRLIPTRRFVPRPMPPRRRAEPQPPAAPSRVAAAFVLRDRAARLVEDDRTFVLLASGVVSVLLMAAFFFNGLLSAWYSNAAAVQMARIELANWGTGEWDSSLELAEFGPAEQLLERSVLYNPHNRTALHRLGLIALHQHNFAAAVSYLEAAHRLAPRHAGVYRCLAYAYAWNGQYAQAVALMTGDPSYKTELANYIAWWNHLARPDLAGHAEAVLERLDQ